MNEVHNNGDGVKTILTIKAFPDGHTELQSSMNPPTTVWTMMQLIINLLTQKQESVIEKPKGGIVNFIRRGMK